MLSYEASAEINASPEKVWELLVDAQAFTDWDPDVTRIEGTIALGEKVTVYTKVSPDRSFPVTVAEFVPNQKMVWASGMPLGLFKGQRTFTLKPDGAGKTHYHVIEQFSGLLLPLIRLTIPDLNEAFQRHAQALKTHAESAS